MERVPGCAEFRAKGDFLIKSLVKYLANRLRFPAFRCATVRNVNLQRTARKPFAHAVFRVIEEVGRARLELATNALKGRCSTIELPTRFREERREVMQRRA